MSFEVDAIYDDGVFRPVEPLVLPDGVRVHLRIEEEAHSRVATSVTGRIFSPRLANPEQVKEFDMEVRELPDAGV